MAALVGRSIAALRTHHDALAALVSDLTDDQLARPSGASEWTVAHVLSHLGSQAEISLVPLAAAVEGADQDAPDNQQVWDRWDAASPREQATAFVEHSVRYQERLETLSAGEQALLRVDLGFLPDPVPLATAVGMRLNEVAQHAWDIEVAIEPAAEVDEESASLLLEHFADGLGFLLGFTAEPDRLTDPASVAIGPHVLAIDSEVSVRPGPDGATAAFEGPRGAALRLLGGRLRAERTPADVQVTGNVTLEELRAVFPGF